jgi:oligo-1,6-glucosidase
MNIEKHGQFPSSLKEERQHGNLSFPCAFYQAAHEANPPGLPFTVKHHWHEPIEIIYLEQDSYQIDINMTITHLKSPCFCFINSGELHAIASDSDQYLEQAVVFSPELLTFAAPDPTQEQFLLPLAEHKLSFPSFLGPDHPAFSEVQQEFFRIRSIFFRENRFHSDQFTIENPISQLRLKASLLNIIGTLAEHALLTSNEPVRNPRVELLKTVISYIRQNYQQPLSLGELAALAAMNEQYFCRFFKKALGKTPVSYINSFRIQHAATLLCTTELPVTEICLESGFNNLGHFMKEFKKATRFTPLQFRRQNKAELFSKNTHSLNERTFTMQRKWWHKKTAYQIYPKSFCDSNGDGIGDLPGIISKLDYLKDLGIDIIWFSPIYCSPLADQGYDISDYYNIDPRFGTMDDMDCLISEAKKRDMYILMDLVVNHCSDEHEWFKKACEDPDGEYGKYFYIETCPDGKLPCNWRSYFGGSVWEPLPGHPDKYYLHMFHKKQPDLNWENPRLREEIYKMINWWLDKGLAGFRIDAIINIKKALPWHDYPSDRADGMCSPGEMLKHAVGVGEFLGEMRDRTFLPHGAFTAGEVFDEKPEELPDFIGDNGYFSTMFDFNETIFGGSEKGWYDYTPITPNDYRSCCFASQKRVGDIGMISNIIENHDEPRGVSHYIPEGECTPASKKLLATMNILLRGLPFIYQGQEIGMENVEFRSISEVDDISTLDEYQLALDAGLTPDAALKAVNRFSRDNARTPFQWDSSANAGFTSGTPWLNVNSNYTRINLENQKNDPDSVYQYYKRLLALRKDPTYSETVIYGDLIPAFEDLDRVMAYYRKSDDLTLLVIGNYKTQPQTLTLPSQIKNIVLNNLPQLKMEGNEILLEGYQAVILEI